MICEICKEEPAVYGDGVTWGRCAKCQQEFIKKDLFGKEHYQQETGNEGVPHQRIIGLTSIVIPIHMANYPLFHMTGNCIGSVREHTDKEKDPYELIILDNGSPVQPPSNQSYYAQKIVKWEENRGVTKAWNAGIRVSFGEYIVLLNNDTQVYEGWLTTLKSALLTGGLDLVMAKPMYSLTEPFARAVEAKREADRWVGKPIEESFDKTGPTDFACVLFRKDLVDELGYEGIGLFREEFVSYCSDIDVLKRMDEAGKKYAVCRAVPIHHIIDATGHSLPNTPQVMDTDKETFKTLWDRPQPTSQPEVRAEPQADTAVVLSTVENLVRTDKTGDKIYFVKDNTLHWVKSPQVLGALGFSFGQERTITDEEFAKYQYGDPIDMSNVGLYKV